MPREPELEEASDVAIRRVERVDSVVESQPIELVPAAALALNIGQKSLPTEQLAIADFEVADQSETLPFLAALLALVVGGGLIGSRRFWQ